METSSNVDLRTLNLVLHILNKSPNGIGRGELTRQIAGRALPDDTDKAVDHLAEKGLIAIDRTMVRGKARTSYRWISSDPIPAPPVAPVRERGEGDIRRTQAYMTLNASICRQSALIGDLTEEMRAGRHEMIAEMQAGRQELSRQIDRLIAALDRMTKYTE